MRHSVPHKSQAKTYTCGPTCLEMLLDFYGIPYDALALEELCGTCETGTDNADLVAAAESLGAKVQAKESATIEDIVTALEGGHPVLVNYFNPLSRVGHFGVVKGIEDGALIFADPKNGDNYELTVGEFADAWHSHNKTIRGWMMYLV